MQPAQRFLSSPVEPEDLVLHGEPAATETSSAPADALVWPPPAEDVESIDIVILEASGAIAKLAPTSSDARSAPRPDISLVPTSAAAPPATAGDSGFDRQLLDDVWYGLKSGADVGAAHLALLTPADDTWPLPHHDGDAQPPLPADFDEMLAAWEPVPLHDLSSPSERSHDEPAERVSDGTGETPAPETATAEIERPTMTTRAADVPPVTVVHTFEERANHTRVIAVTAAAAALVLSCGAVWYAGLLPLADRWFGRTATTAATFGAESRAQIATLDSAPVTPTVERVQAAVGGDSTNDGLQVPPPGVETAAVPPPVRVDDAAVRQTSAVQQLPVAAPQAAVRTPPSAPPMAAAVEPRREVLGAPQTPSVMLPSAPAPLPAPTEVHAPAPGPAAVPREEAARTASTAPAPVPAAPAAVVEKRDQSWEIESEVRQAIASYRDAYANLDAAAAQDVWPSVDERALARAFAGLKSQRLEFDRCDIDVRDTVASASCSGRAVYVQRVGRQDPQTESRHWVFTLRRARNGWRIEQTEIRR